MFAKLHIYLLCLSLGMFVSVAAQEQKGTAQEVIEIDSSQNKPDSTKNNTKKELRAEKDSIKRVAKRQKKQLRKKIKNKNPLDSTKRQNLKNKARLNSTKKENLKDKIKIDSTEKASAKTKLKKEIGVPDKESLKMDSAKRRAIIKKEKGKLKEDGKGIFNEAAKKSGLPEFTKEKPKLEGEFRIENFATNVQNPRTLNEQYYSRFYLSPKLTLFGLPFSTDLYYTTEDNTYYNSNSFSLNFDVWSFRDNILKGIIVVR